MLNYLYKFALQILKDPKLYQYVWVGGVCACLDIGLFLLLNQLVDFHYLVTATFTFLCATLLNYLLCSAFVFKHDYKHSSQKRLFLVYFVSSLGLVIHHTVLFTAFEGFALPIVISKILAMGVAFGWNFLSRKHFVFVMG